MTDEERAIALEESTDTMLKYKLGKDAMFEAGFHPGKMVRCEELHPDPVRLLIAWADPNGRVRAQVVTKENRKYEVYLSVLRQKEETP